MASSDTPSVNTPSDEPAGRLSPPLSEREVAMVAAWRALSPAEQAEWAAAVLKAAPPEKM
jgi:hypothetical protein